MTEEHVLWLAALLHDIGKFRRGTQSAFGRDGNRVPGLADD